ncbi:MAG: class I SAM-dependent methyltransferase [Patescibacteria group bacterium]
MKNDRCYYGTDPSEYDAFGLVTPHHEVFQECIASLLCTGVEAVSQPRILEIGCGTGITTKKVREAVPGASIVAVDKDSAILKIAKRRVCDTHVTYVCQDASTYLHAMKAQSLDAIYSAYCIHNLQPQERLTLFAGIRHALKLGGVYVNGDKIAQNDILFHWKDLREGIDRFQAFAGTKFAHLQSMWTQHYLDDEAIRLTEAEHTMLLYAADCNSVRRHYRWGLDAVVRAIRKS